MIDVRARLPKEEAAVLIAAMDAARDQFGPPPPKPDPAGDCRVSLRRVSGCTARLMRCWMWPGCS